MPLYICIIHLHPSSLYIYYNIYNVHMEMLFPSSCFHIFTVVHFFMPCPYFWQYIKKNWQNPLKSASFLFSFLHFMGVYAAAYILVLYGSICHCTGFSLPLPCSSTYTLRMFPMSSHVSALKYPYFK